MRVAVKIELSDADRQRLERSVAVAERGDAAAGAFADGADGRGRHDEQGDRREAGNRPEQGRAVEAAVRGRGAGRDCEGASAGCATTACKNSVAQAALRREVILADDADRSAGRDALVVPVHGAGGGDDAHRRPRHGEAARCEGSRSPWTPHTRRPPPSHASTPDCQGNDSTPPSRQPFQPILRGPLRRRTKKARSGSGSRYSGPPKTRPQSRLLLLHLLPRQKLGPTLPPKPSAVTV